MNLRKCIVDYFIIYRALELKPTTIKSYLSFLANVPSDWEIETVSALDIQKLINDLSCRLSSSSVKHVFQLIRETLENADLFGTDKRTLSSVKLPKVKRKIVRALSDAELSQLYPEIIKSNYADVFIVLLNTGMRFCELSGLNNSDFSVVNGTLKIQNRFYRGIMAEGSKTDAGIREIPLIDEVRQIIMRNVIIFLPDSPLFLSKRNNRLSYNTILHEWHKICFRANFAPCGLHVLRHTFATRMLNADVSLKVLSAFLGHKSITVTADIYCDVSLSAKRKALLKLQLADNETKNHLKSF